MRNILADPRRSVKHCEVEEVNPVDGRKITFVYGKHTPLGPFQILFKASHDNVLPLAKNLQNSIVINCLKCGKINSINKGLGASYYCAGLVESLKDEEVLSSIHPIF